MNPAYVADVLVVLASLGGSFVIAQFAPGKRGPEGPEGLRGEMGLQGPKGEPGDPVRPYVINVLSVDEVIR